MFSALWTTVDAVWVFLKFGLVIVLPLGAQSPTELHAENRNQFYGPVKTQSLYKNKKGDLQLDGEGVHVWTGRRIITIPILTQRSLVDADSVRPTESIKSGSTTVPLPKKKPVWKPVVIPIPIGKPQIDDSTVDFIQIGDSADTPAGYPSFCRRNPDQCPLRTSITRIWLSKEKSNELKRINMYVNWLIVGKDDIDQYSNNDYWAIPQETNGLYHGDCEDYVLLKKKLLIEAGWPQESLSITIVDDDNDHKIVHAVLTVHTRRGDLILDNMVSEVKFWHETSYAYLKIQSAETGSTWARIQTLQTTASVN